MLELAPWGRLVSALLLLGATLIAHSLPAVLAAYVAALAAVVAMKVFPVHLRFVGIGAVPLLVALLVLWGWLLPENHPAGYSSGVAYALAAWFKIVSCGAVIQALMIPLINRPVDLPKVIQITSWRGSARFRNC